MTPAVSSSTHTRRFCASLLCCGLLVAACGGGDDQAAPSPATPSLATPSTVTSGESATAEPPVTRSDTTTPADPASGDAPGVDDATAIDGDPTAEIILGEVTIDDPTVGPLTFTTRSIGDPSLAAEGRGIIFLHGFPETSASWEHIMGEVTSEGWYAVAFDQRGYSAGARPAAIEDYESDDLVSDVFSVATEMGLDTFHLVGHDWGAAVTWLVAGADTLSGSERVTSMTALSVGHPEAYASAYSDPSADQGAMSSYIDVFSAPDAEDGFLANDAALLRGTFASDNYPEDQIQKYVDVLGTKAALGAALNWYRAIDLRAAAPDLPIEQPTLFVWSTADGALGRDQAERTEAEVSGSYEFVELEGVSHWVPHGAPDDVIAALLPHLETAASS